MNPVRSKKSKIFANQSETSWTSNGMKILIGTPVHESKDYCFRQFLESVKKVTSYKKSEKLFDILFVDNSPSSGYQQKVQNLCEELEIPNFKIIHLDIPEFEDNGNQVRKSVEERVAKCREECRKELIKGSYTHLFFWESDIILPEYAFEKLIQFDSEFDVIMHNYPSRQFPEDEAWGFGCTIIKRKWFENFSFIDPEKRWRVSEARLLKKIRLAGGHWTELHSFLEIKHLI